MGHNFFSSNIIISIIYGVQLTCVDWLRWHLFRLYRWARALFQKRTQPIRKTYFSHFFSGAHDFEQRAKWDIHCQSFVSWHLHDHNTHKKHVKYISCGFQIISLLPQVLGHVEHWCDHLRLPLRNFPFQWGRGYQRADPKRLLHVSSSSFFAQESNSRDDTRTKLHGCKISDITEPQVPTKPLEGDLHTGNRADHKPSAGGQIDKPLQAQSKANLIFLLNYSHHFVVATFEFLVQRLKR